MTFKYDKRGQHCRNLHKSSIYEKLDNRHGINKFPNGSLCSIYETQHFTYETNKNYSAFLRADKL